MTRNDTNPSAHGYRPHGRVTLRRLPGRVRWTPSSRNSGTPVSGASDRQHSCIERSTTWPRPVRRTRAQGEHRRVDGEQRRHVGGELHRRGRGHRRPVGEAERVGHAGRRPRHQLGALPAARGPVSPNGLTATTTWRSWAGAGSPLRRVDVADHHVGGRRCSRRVLLAARRGHDGPLALREERPPQRGFRAVVPGANGGRWRRTWPSLGLDDDDVGAERRPHPRRVRAGQAGRARRRGARPTVPPSRCRPVHAEDLGVVDVRAAQRLLGRGLGERRALASSASTSSGDRPPSR